MKKFTFLFVAIFAFRFCSHAQSIYSFQKTDSIAIAGGFSGFPVKLVEGFGIFNQETLVLQRFSAKLEWIDSIKLIPPAKTQLSQFNPTFIFESGDQFIFLSNNRESMLCYDLKGNFVKKIKLKPKLNKKEYWVDDNLDGVAKPFNANFRKENGTFFLSIRPVNKTEGLSKADYEKYNKEKYQASMIGAFDMNGKLLQTLGCYDDIYRKKVFLSHLDNCIFDMPQGEILINSLALSDSIQLINLKSGKFSRFGQKGKYINMSFEGIPEVRSREDLFLREYSSLIKSPFYWSLNVTSKYIIRTYTVNVEDPVVPDPQEIETRIKWLNGEIKGCLLQSRTEKQQLKVLWRKPFFIQIYDSQTYELLYDGSFESGYPIFMGEEGGFLFFYGNGGNIFKYQLVPTSGGKAP